MSWSEKGDQLAMGTHKGFIQIWDVVHMKKLMTLSGHTGRVGTYMLLW